MRPQLKYFRLALADALSKNLLPDGPRVKQVLEKQMKENGISLKDPAKYDHTNLEALRKRLDEIVLGQEPAKNALLKEFKKIDQGTPIMYLDGPYGTGKTSLGLKWAQLLNSNLDMQKYGTGLESFEASEQSAHRFNAGVTGIQDLLEDDEQTPQDFRFKLTQQLKAIKENSDKFPNRPTTIIFDEIARTIPKVFETMPDSEEYQSHKTMTTIVADAILQLAETHRYEDIDTDQEFCFTRPMLYLTGNATSEKKGQMDIPILDPKVVGSDKAERLRRLLSQGNSVTYHPFSQNNIHDMVKYYIETMVPAAAALKGVHLDLPPHLVETLTKAYTRKGFVGRTINKHLEAALLNPIAYGNARRPGETLRISVDDLALQNLTTGNFDDNKTFVLS